MTLQVRLGYLETWRTDLILAPGSTHPVRFISGYVSYGLNLGWGGCIGDYIGFYGGPIKGYAANLVQGSCRPLSSSSWGLHLYWRRNSRELCSTAFVGRCCDQELQQGATLLLLLACTHDISSCKHHCCR